MTEISIVEFTNWVVVFIAIPALLYIVHRSNKNINFLRRKIAIMEKELKSYDLETSSSNIESALELVDQFCNDNEIERLRSIYVIEKKDEDGYNITITFL